jgi:hypothetical protein
MGESQFMKAGGRGDLVLRIEDSGDECPKQSCCDWIDTLPI